MSAADPDSPEQGARRSVRGTIGADAVSRGPGPDFVVRFATCHEDVVAAQRLRYRIFVAELGGDGPQVDHRLGLERDRFDPVAQHLLLIDKAREGGADVVGVYRLMDEAGAARAGQFYCDGEYDLGVLRAGGRRLLELGRSCIDPDYRGGTAMMWLWQALAAEVRRRGIDVLFGVASFHGTDVAALAGPLSLLHHRHLAPTDLRVRAREFQPMDLVPADRIDRRAALLATPALIKAYLRLGGFVGEGAFVDHAFNTTDVCLILDTARLKHGQAAIYSKDGPES
jgi:L-ornithine Nalpha-acyltransferase